MAVIENRQSREGIALGAELGRMTDASLADHQAHGGRVLERCASCAYRSGTFPNGCLPTVLDAIKCTAEGEVFMCHEDPRPCRGWIISRLGLDDRVSYALPWAFSTPAEENDG